MNPEQKAGKLLSLACAVEEAADLAGAAEMAVSSLSGSERDSLKTLLMVVVDRLSAIARGLKAEAATP